MSKTKSGGTTALGRDSQPQYLGIKISGGQMAKPGSIIVRQRGSSYIAGKNVATGKDYTLFSLINGIVKFTTKRIKRYDNKHRIVKMVSVEAK